MEFPGKAVTQTITSGEEVKASEADKRRSTRVAASIAIVVAGVDTLGEPFREATTTTEVNCYGCRYRTKNYLQKGANVAVEIPHPELRLPARLARGRVIWVQRPRRMRETYHVALEFEVPGNIWGIASPPKDWFAHPDDEKRAVADAASDLPRPTGDIASSDELLQATLVSPELVRSERETQVLTAEELTFTLGHLGGAAEPAGIQTLSRVVEQVVDKALKQIREQMMERVLAAIAETQETSQLTMEEMEMRIRQALEGAIEPPSGLSASGKSTKRRRSRRKLTFDGQGAS